MAQFSNTPKLDEEVLGWPIEEFKVVGLRIPVHCLNPTGLVRRDWSSSYATGLTLGWIGASDISEQGDKWSLTFREDSPGAEWGEVTLPQNWNGQLWQRLVEEERAGSWVLGRLGKSKREGFLHWGSPCRASKAPKLPKLQKGDWEQRRGSQMRLVGVLRVAEPRTYGAAGEMVRLLAGWADPKGEFLGWEMIADMGVVHDLNPEELRLIGEMRDFDTVEGKLRGRSWGREF